MSRTDHNPLAGLVEDINKVLDGSHVVDEKTADRFASRMKELLLSRFNGKQREPRVSGSNYGHPCNRKAFLNINNPDGCEKVGPQLRLKFLYGDLVEELVTTLIEMSGNKVEGLQDTMKDFGITGARDLKVNGVTCDIKSASGYGIRKFMFHDLIDDDPFSYLPQVSYYRHAENETDPTDTPDKREPGAAFIAVDKVTGNIVVDYYSDGELYAPEDIQAAIIDVQEDVGRSDPPPKAFKAVADGKSGNMVLCTNCKYCNARWACWDGLKAYQYSNGPRYFTKVLKKPADKIPNVTSRLKKEAGV